MRGHFSEGVGREEALQGPHRHRAHQSRAVAQTRFGGGGERGLAGIADRDQHIAHKAITGDALDRRAAEQFAKRRIVQRGEIGKPRRAQLRPRREGDFARSLREFVPGTDRQTVVAAVDAIADGAAEFLGDVVLVLDREIGNSEPRIDLVRRGKGIRRTDIQAVGTGAAAVRLRLVRLQLQRREDRAEKKPGAEFARDQIGMLALPAEAGGMRQRFSITGAVSTKIFTSAPWVSSIYRATTRRRFFSTS